MAQNYRDKDLRGRNFAGQNLTNADFRGADVSGADFSGANLTGARFSPSKQGKTRAVGANFHKAKLLSTNFTKCNLQDANLTESSTGIRERLAKVKGLVGFILLFLLMFINLLFTAGYLAVSISYTISIIDREMSISIANISYVIIGIGIGIFTFSYILMKGINDKIFSILAFAFVFIFGYTGINWIAFAFAFSIAAVLTFALTSAISVVIKDIIISIILSTALILTIILGTGSVMAPIAGSFGFIGTSNAKYIILSSIITILFTILISRRTYQDDIRYIAPRSLGVRIGILGSTRFQHANLNYADFGAAQLRFADFRHATLLGTNWANTKQLNLAQFDRDYLNTPALRTLAIQRDGRGQVYDGLNLSGLHLARAQLQGASFVSANLNHVNLQAADLSEAVLKQTQLDGATLSAANLSGATIEDWGITVNTQLDNIRCTHVYMRAAGDGVTNRLRKPDNENEVFAEGEFAEFIRPLTDTLDLYHSQGVDPRAMSAAIKHMSERHPEAEPQIVAMERRGQHGFNVRVQVTPEADKSALSADYFAEYIQFKALAETEKQTLMARLEEKDSRIVSLENMITQALQPQRYYDDPEAGLPASARALVRLINTHFSLEEVEGLCFEMGIDDENLRGQTKIAKIRTLVKHCHRTATIEALKQHMLAQRPNLRD